MTPAMKVCFVTSECVPYAKTGGLADVSGALPQALARLGCSVKVFLPLYQSINTIEHDLSFCEDLYELRVDLGPLAVTFNVWYGRLGASKAEVYLIDSPAYYHRPSIYTGDADEDERFLLLQHAAFVIMQRYGWAPDIVHSNDWPTALIPPMIKDVYAWDGLFDNAGSVLTIHNVGYQGRFDASSVGKAGLSSDSFFPGGPFEFEGSFSFLKSGILYADAVTTVSPTYADEIQRPEYGAGLHGVLHDRAADVFGILNGIDTDHWSPSTDALIPYRYNADTLERKADNKRALRAEVGLADVDGHMLIGIVSRLAAQKGFDILQPVLEPLFAHHALQLVVLGSGESRYEDFFRWAQGRFPGQVAVHIGYSDRLAHWIEAGADAFLMPSQYEPCGLNQMYSLNYGTIPIVRRTGGLADTVIDYYENPALGNGISFNDFTPQALESSIVRANVLYHQPSDWRTMQLRGMADDFSWEAAAKHYMDVYHHAISNRVRTRPA